MVDGQPCCVNCYEDKHAKRCSHCQKAIVADVEYLEFEDKYWHKDCFTCSKCHVKKKDSFILDFYFYFVVEMYCRRKFLSRWKFNFMQRLYLIIKIQNYSNFVCMCVFALKILLLLSYLPFLRIPDYIFYYAL
jgi:hypothetical protein